MTKYFIENCHSNLSYRDRIGEPDELEASLGRVVLSFSELEDAVSCVIAMLIGADASIGQIVTAGMSFRVKVDVLGSLARFKIEGCKSSKDDLAQLADLIRICRLAEQRRNRIIHSTYISGFRVKTSAGSKHGLRSVVSLVNSAELMNTADYCAYVADIVEGYPLDLGLATSINVSSESELKYRKAGDDGVPQDVFVFKKISVYPVIGP